MTLTVDIGRQTMKEVGSKAIGGDEKSKGSSIDIFNNSGRTANYVILDSGKGKLQFLDISSLSSVHEVTGVQDYQYSLTDDQVLINKGKSDFRVINLKTKDEAKIKIDGDDCTVMKNKQSESLDA